MRSFVTLVSGLLLVIFLVCFGWRWTALQQKYQPLQHPLAQIDDVVIAYQAGSAEAPANTWVAIDRLAGELPDVIVWLDLHQTKDDVFVLYGNDYLDDLTTGTGHIWRKDYEQIKELHVGTEEARIRRLDETLKKYPQTRFILNNISNKQGTDERLAELLKEQNTTDRVILTSPFDVILRSLRIHHPLLMYGSSRAELTRLLMLDAIGLAPLAPIKADIIVTADPRIFSGFDESLIEEVHRRKKLVISGFVKTMEEKKLMNQMGFNGVITDAPYKLLRSSFD